MRLLISIVIIALALNSMAEQSSETNSSLQGDASEYFNQGVQYERLGQIDSALTSYSNALKKSRSIYEAYINIGAIFYRKANYDHALKIFKEGLTIGSSPLLYINTAMTLNKLGKHQEAINLLINSQMNNNKDIFFHIGESYYEMNDFTRAAEYYRKALSIQEDIEALNNLASAYINLEEYDKAEKTLKSAIEKYPDFTILYYNLGIAEFRQNKYRDAVKYWEIYSQKQGTNELKDYINNAKSLIKDESEVKADEESKDNELDKTLLDNSEEK